MSLEFTIDTPQQWAELGRTVPALVDQGKLRYPLQLSMKVKAVRANKEKLDAMMAMVRDICRFYHGSMTVPERVVDAQVEKLKHMQVNGKDIWPRESESTPDYFTGEVLYPPVSRSRLTDPQIRGIMDWLSEYMVSRRIPSNDPKYRDADAQYGEAHP